MFINYKGFLSRTQREIITAIQRNIQHKKKRKERLATLRITTPPPPSTMPVMENKFRRKIRSIKMLINYAYFHHHQRVVVASSSGRSSSLSLSPERRQQEYGAERSFSVFPANSTKEERDGVGWIGRRVGGRRDEIL